MDFDFTWLLFGLPIAFALGWLASRFDLHQLRVENRRAPKAYFRGLNYLLNEQQDQAIDAFIEAVQKDPDTSELHFALGNLFRRRGEYERAVRVHEHLLSRADLGHADRERAQYALALDFLKAGLLDHAEEALRKLDDTHHQEQAWLARLNLYERARDWTQAAEMAGRLQAAGQTDFSGRLTHYLCEQAEDAMRKQGDLAGARALLGQAIDASPDAARPRIQLAGLFAKQGHLDLALQQLMALPAHAPRMIPLIASELVRLAKATNQLAPARTLLQNAYQQTPSIDIADALVQADLSEGVPALQARRGYVDHMAHEPSLIAAARWLNSEPFADDDTRKALQGSLEHAVRPLARYRCAACGFEAQGYFWQCPGCQAWESFPPRRIEEL